jgi:hypothetical protein
MPEPVDRWKWKLIVTGGNREHADRPDGVRQQPGSVTEELPGTWLDSVAVRAGRHRCRAPWVIAVVVVLVTAGVALAVARPFATGGAGGPMVAENSYPTGLYTVARQDLSSQTEVSATLGYADSYSVVNQSRGTVTWLPAVGQAVRQGQDLYEVNGAPVALLYGQTPAYRSLSEGMIGRDVEELNADLVVLGYATGAEIPSGTDEFTWRTKLALERFESKLNVAANGTLSLGQVVFLPTVARITSVSATLGAPAGPGESVLSATSTTRQVSIALAAYEQSDAAVGDKVTITLPNNEATPGVVSSVGTVAVTSSSGGGSSGGGSPTITVLVSPTDPVATGDWDQSSVNVTITTGSVANALVVPVDALLAQAGSGYAVEVVDAHGVHHLVAVSLGLFDDADGLVQVTGSALAAGQRVVVPSL